MRTVCPLCGSPLTALRFAQVIKQHRGIERQMEKLRLAQGRAQRQLGLAKERVRATLAKAKARTAKTLELERRRSEDRLRKYAATATKLRLKVDELKDRLRRGETAQSEGLLEERNLLVFLKEHFPDDRFEHVGKGGDIVHDVCTTRGQRAGRIVYEVKREDSWKNKNILQAADARIQRNANLAVLVTNRFPAKRQYYFVEREVLIVNPQGILPVVHTAREGLLSVHALSASKDQKNAAVRVVFEYLASGAYIGQVRKMSQHFHDLEELFHQEIRSHRKVWNGRLGHYRGIASGIASVHEKLRGAMVPVGKLESAARLLPRFEVPPQVTKVISST